MDNENLSNTKNNNKILYSQVILYDCNDVIINGEVVKSRDFDKKDPKTKELILNRIKSKDDGPIAVQDGKAIKIYGPGPKLKFLKLKLLISNIGINNIEFIEW